MRATLSHWRNQGGLATAALSFAAGALVASALVWSAQPGGQPSRPDLAGEISHLSLKVQQLEQKQASAGRVLTQHRNSICYIYGIYSVGRGANRTRTSFSGTGFIVDNGVIATNRHVAEPWYDDAAAQARNQQGEPIFIDKMLAFFPGESSPVELRDVRASRDADVAIARFRVEKGFTPAPIPLTTTAAAPGDSVVVIGYPLGLMGMMAKSPRVTYRRLMNTPDDMQVVRELARLALIRPSATGGQVGDVLDDILVYDAPTARGGSGAPVFNSDGEVVAVTSAYLRGFSGGTMGVSVSALRPLLEQK